MSPRPGRVVLDLSLPLVESAMPSNELRSDPDFMSAGRQVRDAIARSIP